MTDELEAVPFGEGLHLRNDHGVAARAAQPSQVRVVDDAFPGRIAPEHECLVQETLHRETVEDTIELQVPPFGVTQVDQAGDEPGPLLGEFHLGDRGVMLHLGARLVGHAVAACGLTAAQSQLAQHPCQRRVPDLDALFLHEFLVDPLHPAVTLAVETLQQLGVNPLLVAPLPAGELSLLLDDLPHRIAADLHPAADLPQRHPRLM